MAKQIIEETDEEIFITKCNTLANSGLWEMFGWPNMAITETN